ncbi:hypothetical protein E4T49_07756 [Aureobasidium sp. EXF-10728]|nr:hypothetical protein E4T49_07756 [Aureobasidium sp. EXF-10728]
MTSSVNPKDSDTLSQTSTLAGGIATTDFAPRTTTTKTNHDFIALQTLLETPELVATTSSSNTSETFVDSQSLIKKHKRLKLYWIMGFTAVGSCMVLASILVVIFGPRPVGRNHARWVGLL